MNKTVAFSVLAAAGVLALAGLGVLTAIEGGEGGAQRFADQALVILALLGAAGGLVHQQGKLADQVGDVQKQTNGTLTKLLAERDELRDELGHAREQLASRTSSIPKEEPPKE